MQPQPNNSTNRSGRQAPAGYSKTNRGREEGRGSKARYLEQLQKMNSTARRNNWRRVVFALSALIARRGGIA